MHLQYLQGAPKRYSHQKNPQYFYVKKLKFLEICVISKFLQCVLLLNSNCASGFSNRSKPSKNLNIPSIEDRLWIKPTSFILYSPDPPKMLSGFSFNYMDMNIIKLKELAVSRLHTG